MEVREILVANTRTQRKHKISTGAETLGELKEALDNAGIDYTGLTFTEGITKTGLLDDNTPLPKDVMFKGTPTNNLVIILTNTKKDIASGAEGTRKEAYDIIREEGLQADVHAAFGCNYTNVSTAHLWNFINSLEAAKNEDEDDDLKDELGEDNFDDEDYADDDQDELIEADEIAYPIYEHLKLLVKAGVLKVAHLCNIREMLDEFIARTAESQETFKVGNSVISDDDINDMISSL